MTTGPARVVSPRPLNSASTIGWSSSWIRLRHGRLASTVSETPSTGSPAPRPIRDGVISMRREAGGSGAAKAIAMAQARQQDAAATAAIASNVVAGPKGWAAYGAMNPDERRAALDDLGFSRQLVFTTFAGSQFMPATDLEVKYGGSRALNRAIAEWCSADKRLIAVGVVPLDDPAQ